MVLKGERTYVSAGVGHHMLMILGKTQLMRLFRARVAQLGDAFVLRDFMDFVADIGWIPWSLITWCEHKR